MIDFRYHIVSLISVFLALAVGIALGAGPLEATIGTQLTEQVDQLRQETDRLRTDLEVESAVSDHRAGLIDDAAAELLAGALPRDVAVVTLPGVDSDVVDEVVARLGQAGATVTARVDVGPAWTDPEQQSLRSSLVGSLAGYLRTPPAPEESADAVLARALAAALTTAADGSPTELAAEAGPVLEVLASAQLAAATGEPERPARAVAVLAPSADDEGEPVDALVTLAEELAAASEGAVVAGPTGDAAGVVAAVRGSDAAQRVATVDGIGELTGQVVLPRVLARAVAGEIGHYGYTGSADEVLPPRVDLTQGTA